MPLQDGEAGRQRDIDDPSSKADASAAEGDWDVVLTALGNLTATQRRTALVDEMTALHQAGRWNAVLAAARVLARIDPDNSDPDGIVSDAQARLREAEPQTTIPTLPIAAEPPDFVAVHRRWQPRSRLVAAAIGVFGVVLVAGLIISAGVQSPNSSNKATSTSTATATTSAPAVFARASGPHETVGDYLEKNNIQATTIARGIPGTPTIDLPVPLGWKRIPEGADAPYGGIVFNTPTDPRDPPKIIAIVARLTGHIDTDALLAVAPGEVKNLPGYRGSDGAKSTLSGHPAYQIAGSYTKNGVTRMVAQKTVVIRSGDGIYVLQLNAEGPQADASALNDATGVIDEKISITP